MNQNSVLKRGDPKYIKSTKFHKKKIESAQSETTTPFKAHKGRPKSKSVIINTQINLEDLKKDATILHSFLIFQKLPQLILENIHEKFIKDSSNKNKSFDLWMKKKEDQQNYKIDYSQVEQIELENAKKDFLLFVDIFLNEEHKCLNLNESFLVFLRKIAVQFIKDVDNFDIPESKRKPIEILFEIVKNNCKGDILIEKDINIYFGEKLLDSFLKILEELRKFYEEHISA